MRMEERPEFFNRKIHVQDKSTAHVPADRCSGKLGIAHERIQYKTVLKQTEYHIVRSYA